MYFYEDEDEEDEENENLGENNAEETEDSGENGEEETGGDEGAGGEGAGAEKNSGSGGDGDTSLGEELKNKLRQGAEDAGFLPKKDKGEGEDNSSPNSSDTSNPLDENQVRNDLNNISNGEGGNNQGEGNGKGKNNKGEDGKDKKDGDGKGKDKSGGDNKGNANKSETPKKPEAGGDKPNAAGNSKLNKAKNIAKGAKEGGAKGAAKEAGKEVAKEVAKKAIQKSGAMRFVAMIPPVALFWIAVAVVVFIILVGFIFFIVSMPGQIMGKFKEIGKQLMQEWQALMEGEENVVMTEDIARVANYLESMGYDLRGEGFVSSAIPEDSFDLNNDEDKKRWNNIEDTGAMYDEEQGVWRDESDEIVDLNSDPIMTYIVSDNLCYIIKNFNQNIETAGEEGKGFILGMFAAITAVVVMFTPIGWIGAICIGAAGSLLAFKTAGNPEWGTGLITIWHEKDGIVGKKGKAYDPKEQGYISLDPETKKLTVKRGWANGPYIYDVDGWSGRYGMPLEFLLSVHIATKMPDLAMEMAFAFDTDVAMLLRSIEGGEMKAGFQIGEDEYVEFDEDFKDWGATDNNLWDDLGNAMADFVGWLGFWNSDAKKNYSITARVAAGFLEKFKIPHYTEECQCCSHIKYSNASEDFDDWGQYNGNHENCDKCVKETKDRKTVVTEHRETCYDKDDSRDNKNNFTSEKRNTDKHYVCPACADYVKKIVSGLKVVVDAKWESYTPYISSVTDHWFRDVYFVIDNPNSTEVLGFDEEYYLETNERWTMYETYTTDDEENGDIPEGFAVGDYKLYEYDNGNYTLSTKTKEEVEELNEKIANGDTSVSKLVKKSITSKLDANDGSKWSAYETEAENIVDWTELPVTDEAPDVLKDPDLEHKIYYKEIRPGDIIQVEDGQRGVTNTKIKDMFINKAYYKYDGTAATAEVIEEDRANTKREKDNTDEDGRNEELISKVSLAKDSLTAFSILQNTKTLDADYIYRDFKELIVELDYFDKEDLSDKVSTVMQWILPQSDASGWPIRKYQKGENFYGTLIQSQADLDLITTAEVRKAEEQLAELENEVPSEGEDEEVEPTGTVPAGAVTALIEKGYEVHAVMEGNGWDYCVNGSFCDHRNGNACGLNSTIQEAQNDHHNTCCATYVSWVLKEAGFDLSNHPNMHGAKATYDWCKSEGWVEITDYTQLQPGDLLFNNYAYTGNDVNQIGHVQMLGNDGQWLNAGGVDPIDRAPVAYDTRDPDTGGGGFIIGMRSTMNGTVSTFKGYEPNEVVVSPLTGKVVEYGTVTRQNEETGQYEDVEFIKIEAIREYLYDTTSPKGEAYRDCDDIEDLFENEVTDTTRKNLEGYDYFYDEYQGVLDGFVLYIEGIDLTLFDSVGGTKTLVESGTADRESVSLYQKNATKDLLDDLREAQSIWQEDAKEAAIPLITIGEDLYIKEGTIIGKTMADNPAMASDSGNGNYIRIILRDWEDSIIEDVETYFDIVNTTVFNGSAGNIQNIDGINPELAGLIESLAGPYEAEYPGIVNILKAISMNESSGGNNPDAGDDPMQAAESTGAKAGSSMGSIENSVKAGINALLSAWDKAKEYGITDLRIVIQAYNYGSGFVDYMYNNGATTYSKEMASQFSDEKAAEKGWDGYGDKNYVDPKIYNYIPELNV